jgi:hypothetical protein
MQGATVKMSKKEKIKTINQCEHADFFLRIFPPPFFSLQIKKPKKFQARVWKATRNFALFEVMQFSNR